MLAKYLVNQRKKKNAHLIKIIFTLDGAHLMIDDAF